MTSFPPLTPLSKLPNFDPRTVPVLEQDHRLPAVTQAQLESTALRQRFSNPPDWSPEILGEPRFTQRQMVQASVLIAIIEREQPTVLLTQRTSHLSNHSGQIAFPGGKVDDTDADAVMAALREAQEEVGLSAEFIHVLGTLPIYTTGSAFLVTPVVALVQPDHRVTANPHEVADIFEVPLDFLMDPANHRRHAIEWAGSRREWLSMPYMDATAERFIWGATAGMLRNFYRYLLT